MIENIAFIKVWIIGRKSVLAELNLCMTDYTIYFCVPVHQVKQLDVIIWYILS